MKIMIILACCLSLVFSTLNGPAARVDETGGEQNVESEKPGDSTKPTPLPAETESYKLTPDTFDENLLRYVASVTKGSYMVSPLSFRYALSLLLAG
ncbi:MAG: hypothetical protein GX633_00530, partial [Clostridiales bacterium]|nr:hypothetical protein [Clostridiales bacterium]